MFQVMVFWVVTLCSFVVGNQRFRGPCYLHLQDGMAGRARVTLQLTVGRSVSPSVRPSWPQAPSGTHDQIFALVRTIVLSVMGHPP